MSAPADVIQIPFDRTSRSYQRRWWILGVLNFSLLAIIVDGSILNVALPALQRSLHANNSDLQWMVDSYTLVFAGMLLTAGTLGDKFGRRGALQFGLAIFGLGSLLSAFTTSPGQLIVTRGIMGFGGAFIMPATLSIITNVFPPEERARAIAMWAAVAGAGIAIGPIAGGLLLAHFYWGSVFLVNIPVVASALVAGFVLIPTSKDPSNPALDVIGAALSIVGLVALVYAIIEAPQLGWSATRILVSFAVSAVALALFAVWELCHAHPMLDIRLFKNPRFTAASTSVTFVFFAMMGSMFLLTQYFQFVMGYTALETGVRMLPTAFVMMVVAPLSARLVDRFGSKVVVSTGLFLTTIGLLSFATVPSVHPTYAGDILWRLVEMAFGMGLVMAPATDSIMGSLPRAKAGVGSAVNDTTREVGGALGVAVIGTVMTSTYSSTLGASITRAGVNVPAPAVAQAKQGLGFALGLAGRAPVQFRGVIVADAKAAFVSGLHHAVIVAAIAAFVGFLIALRWLPARATEQPTEEPVDGQIVPQPLPAPDFAVPTIRASHAMSEPSPAP